MGDDLMGYLGIDTKSFVRSMKEAEKAVGFFAKAGILASGVVAIGFGVTRAIGAFTGLGREIDDVRGKLVAGTSEAKAFESAIGGESGRSAPMSRMARLGNELKNFWLGTKTAALQSFEGINMAYEDMLDFALDKATGSKRHARKRQSDRSKYASEFDLAKQILAQEDEISRKREEGVVTIGQHRDLLASELLLLKQQYELFRQGPLQDREKANALKAQIGAIKVQQQELEIAAENEIRRATARTDSMNAENKGMANIAKMIETIADFEEKILKARHEGKYVLEQQLEAQRKLTLQQLAVAEHNMTPRERLDARRTARKFARDVTKTEAHEKDLDARVARAWAEGHSATPGSELARHSARRAAERAGRAQNGKDAKAGGDPQSKMAGHLESIDQKMTTAFKLK